MKFVQLAKSLQEGVAPVYLIEGEETYFRDHAVESIRAACGLQNPMLNDARCEGDAVKGDPAALVRALATLPFLDQKRLVRVYEYYPSEREWESFFAPYCAHPSPSTVFLIVNAGKKAGAAELRKKQLVYVDCGREDEEMLARWLFGVARRQGLAMDADAASLMVQFCNRDAARMKKETEKLALMLGDGARIGRDAVEAYVARDTEYRIYELTQAASAGNYGRFSTILSDMLGQGLPHAVRGALFSASRRGARQDAGCQALRRAEEPPHGGAAGQGARAVALRAAVRPLRGRKEREIQQARGTFRRRRENILRLNGLFRGNTLLFSRKTV